MNKFVSGLSAAIIGLVPLQAVAQKARAQEARTQEARTQEARHGGSVVIRYALSLAGLPIGTATLTAIVSDNGPYKLDATARVGGLMSAVSDGKGSASASGILSATRALPDSYALNVLSDKKPQTVQMAFTNHAVSALALNPELPPKADRVPVTAADKTGVIDPLSALLVPVPGPGPVLNAKACKRTLPVFDGAQRFDVDLSFARTEQVEAKGYSGPAIVCSARYVPIAGHRPGRPQTKFMVANRDLEIWLTPVNGTRILAPWRVIVGTQIGRLSVDTVRYGQANAD